MKLLSLFPSDPSIQILLAIAVPVILFMVLRELFLWYWKINESIKNQKEIIRLLKKSVGEKDEEVDSENKPE